MTTTIRVHRTGNRFPRGQKRLPVAAGWYAHAQFGDCKLFVLQQLGQVEGGYADLSEPGRLVFFVRVLGVRDADF